MAVRISMAAWTVGTVLAGVSIVSIEKVVGSPVAPTVTVHVTDRANRSPTELGGAQAYAGAAYHAAGLHLVWSSMPWKPDGGQSGDPLSIVVRLVIVPADMAEKKCREENLDDSVLGIAVSGASEARGRVAYVFYHRIQRVAMTYDTPVMFGLGHVMAHEIGHVLMGGSGHSADGLMTANWNPRRNRQTFTRPEVRQILRRFMAPLGLRSIRDF